MSSLEERVTALEDRVERLAAESQHSSDIAVVAAREALTARDAHQKNIELLNALRKTQFEHSQTLTEHGRTLAEHSQALADHTTRLNSIDDRLGSIEGTLGVLTVGVHTIESMLTRLMDDEGRDHS